jgi:hypothetical protein
VKTVRAIRDTAGHSIVSKNLGMSTSVLEMNMTLFRCALILSVLLATSCSTRSSSAGNDTPALRVPRPTIVSSQEWGSTPLPIPDTRKHVPKYITIHHAGVLWEGKTTPDRFVKNMQAWGQKDKNWPDLPYHFLIAPDGRIFEGRPLVYEPESNTKYPLSGNIGVEMMGNFERQRPSPEQLRSCVALVAWLAQEYSIDPANIRGHSDAAPGQTTCPGRDFYRYLQDGQFRTWVQQTLDGKGADVEPGPPLSRGPTTSISQWPVTPPATRPD